MWINSKKCLSSIYLIIHQIENIKKMLFSDWDNFHAPNWRIYLFNVLWDCTRDLSSTTWRTFFPTFSPENNFPFQCVFFCFLEKKIIFQVIEQVVWDDLAIFLPLVFLKTGFRKIFPSFSRRLFEKALTFSPSQEWLGINLPISFYIKGRLSEKKTFNYCRYL